MQSPINPLIPLALEQKVIQFGEFKLKSGRTSPYFFNLGHIDNGPALKQLADLYAKCIHRHFYQQGLDFDLLLGPAYKGIPLATATSLSLMQQYDKAVKFAFNRKEAKQHGEGGLFLGAPIKGKILLIDDVITAGTAVRSLLSLIDTYPNAEVVGLVVSFDRQERAGETAISATQALTDSVGIPVYPIATFTELLNVMLLQPNLCTAQHLDSMKKYWHDYGAERAK